MTWLLLAVRLKTIAPGNWISTLLTETSILGLAASGFRNKPGSASHNNKDHIILGMLFIERIPVYDGTRQVPCQHRYCILRGLAPQLD